MAGLLQRLFGIGLLVGAAWSANDAWTLRREGVVADGIVVANEHVLEIRSDSVSFMHRPIVEFRVAGRRRPVRFESDVWSSWRAPSPGAPIRVRYRPEAPEHARVDSLLRDLLLPSVLFLVGSLGLLGRLRPDRDWVIFSHRWKD